MPRDRRLIDPRNYLSKVSEFFTRGGNYNIDYNTAFSSTPQKREPPFNINRFTSEELGNKLVAKKLSQNPRLNFNSGHLENFSVFANLGRFDRDTYNFDVGAPIVEEPFTQQPDFLETGEDWVQAYKTSPTLSKRVKNPNPRLGNLDPLGNLMKLALSKAEESIEPPSSIAQLMAGKTSDNKKETDKKSEEA